MTPKERLLRTINFEKTDYVPLCFLQFEALRQQCKTEEEFIRGQMALGVEPLVWLPELLWGADPGVKTESWVEAGEPYSILHKKWITPKGTLEAEAAKTADWPYGDDIPLMSDPGMARQSLFPVRDESHLDALEWMLQPPDERQIANFRAAVKPLRALADKHQLAVRGGITLLADVVGWLCGGEQIALLGMDQPDLLRRLLDIISNWQLRGMQTVMEARPDVYVQGEWYCTPFLSPALFDEFYAPVFRKYVDLAHQGGAKFCFLGTANMMPFLENFKRLGVDVIFGIDPIQGNWDFARAKAICGRDIALWGGVNAYLQLVGAKKEDIVAATRHAMETLAPGGGFILSPVDDTKIWDEGNGQYARWEPARENIEHMVKVWKELR